MKITPIQQQNNMNFQAMKPSQFKGFDYAVVRKFKAPVEKFNENADFQAWAKKQFSATINKLFGGRSQEVMLERISYLLPWRKYLESENDAYTPAMALLAASAITKELKPDTDTLPPLLNQGVLADSFAHVEKLLMDNKDNKFDFLKVYKEKLKALCVKVESEDKKDFTGWVKIPSQIHDTDNFDANIEKLKILSHENWCTKSFNAEPYLKTGDFHIYLENGNPKVGIRFLYNKIREIQGEKNNGEIPLRYLNTIKKYIKDEQLPFLEDSDIAFKLANAEYALGEVERVKTAIGEDAIENNDVEQILNFFSGYDVMRIPETDLLSIKAFYQPAKLYTFADLGIDENKMFKKIGEVREFLTLRDSQLTSLGNCRVVGELLGRGGKLQSLGSLEKIGSAIVDDKNNLLDFSKVQVENEIWNVAASQ
jgi:hypothetical protein